MEAALRETRLHPRDEPNVRRAELQLGDAYDQVGRVEDARALLRAARDEFLRYANPGMPYTVGAQERWGRFLLDHGHPQEAAAEFTAALASAHGAASAQAAMAASGLARVALAAGALPEAEAQSARALALLDATEGIYDARLRVEIWMVRAQVLAAGGRMPQAQALAEKAVAAATQYDAPVSRQLARVRAVLQGMRDATPH
jgi:serine/threonine-protein kinase